MKNILKAIGKAVLPLAKEAAVAAIVAVLTKPKAAAPSITITPDPAGKAVLDVKGIKREAGPRILVELGAALK